VVYSKDGEVAQIDLESSNFIVPNTALSNEVSAEFFDDVRLGRRLARRRSKWVFELKLEFPSEITGELFEDDFLDPVRSLPRDSEKGLLHVLLYLVDAEYNHPPQQNPSSGSKVTYTFEAVEGRR
jgi:hypothetical protein